MNREKKRSRYACLKNNETFRHTTGSSLERFPDGATTRTTILLRVFDPEEGTNVVVLLLVLLLLAFVLENPPDTTFSEEKKCCFGSKSESKNNIWWSCRQLESSLGCCIKHQISCARAIAGSSTTPMKACCC
jgi:hypothetical protein